MTRVQQLLLFFVSLSLSLIVVAAPPRRDVAQDPPTPPPQPTQPQAEHVTQHATPQAPTENPYQFSYSKYLEEVVRVLESEPKFNDRLKQMREEDIKAGKIADHIDDLDEAVFERLTKAKLQEIERLRDVIAKQIERDNGTHNVKIPDHLDLDQNTWEKFGKEDLRKLIVKTVKDMEEIDRERKEQFKEYEMAKKAEQDHELAKAPDAERVKLEQEIADHKKAVEHHEPLNHPGGREQLEEVWEKDDEMSKDTYDPKTFFALHDLNGDGLWNAEELESLFQIELGKLYNESDPNTDINERMEEMHRMREHVVEQMDRNKDRMISLEEFLLDQEAQQPGKADHEGWQDLQQKPVYTEEELKKFEAEYAKQQGWGDDAYQHVQPGAQPPQYQAPPYNPPPPPGQVPPVQQQLPQQVHPNIQQQQQQQQQHQPVPSAAGQQQQQQQQQQAPQPIHDNKIDPSYGI